MTNEERNYREEVFGNLDRANRGIIIGKGLESNVGPIIQKARGEKREYGLEGLLNDNQFGEDNNQPLLSREEFETKSEEEQNQLIDNYFESRPQIMLREAVDTFAQNPDDVLKDGEKYDPNLTKLANVKEVVGFVPDEFEEIVREYSVYEGINQLAKDIEERGVFPEEQKEMIVKSYANRKSREAYDRKKKEGWNDKLCKLASGLEQMAAVATVNNDKLKKEVEDMRDETKSKLGKKYGNDVSSKVAEYVGKALTEMIRTGDAKNEALAVNLLYSANKGYSVGGQDFNEEYKVFRLAEREKSDEEELRAAA